HLVPDLGPVLDVALVEDPIALAGRGLASGLALHELAFVWGRFLVRFRRELRALSFFRTPGELGSLLDAALVLGRAPGMPSRSLGSDGERLYAFLRRELRGLELSSLEDAAAVFPIGEVATRARRSLLAAELVGVRAGLLASGDVVVAANL